VEVVVVGLLVEVLEVVVVVLVVDVEVVEVDGVDVVVVVPIVKEYNWFISELVRVLSYILNSSIVPLKMKSSPDSYIPM
jgi:hypothetical protein